MGIKSRQTHMEMEILYYFWYSQYQSLDYKNSICSKYNYRSQLSSRIAKEFRSLQANQSNNFQNITVIKLFNLGLTLGKISKYMNNDQINNYKNHNIIKFLFFQWNRNKYQLQNNMDKAKEALEKLGVATIAIMPEVLAGGSPVVVGGVVAGAALVLVGAAVGYGIYYFFFKKSNDPQQEPLLGDQQKRIQERIREILQEYGDVPARNIYTDEQLNQISSISTQSFVKTYQELLCPITNQLFIVPVSLRCSHQFERSAIVQHIVRSGRCPTCNQQAKIQDIRVAQGTTNAVERWRKRAIKKGRQYLEQRIKADFDNQIVS